MPEAPSWFPTAPPTAGPVGSVRRTRGEATVQRILDAGRATFRKYGYEGARVDDIVELAGISHGAFYLYFRNKEDLLHRMAVDCGARLRELTADLAAMPRPPERDELYTWVSRFVGAYHDNGPVIRAWLDNRDPDPLMQALARESLGPLSYQLSTIVEPGTSTAVGERLSGLSLLSLLERLSSYYPDADHDVVAETATALLHATTIDPALTR
jgi:AcrR family transcriptional regulator